MRHFSTKGRDGQEQQHGDKKKRKGDKEMQHGDTEMQHGDMIPNQHEHELNTRLYF